MKYTSWGAFTSMALVFRTVIFHYGHRNRHFAVTNLNRYFSYKINIRGKEYYKENYM
jgi:hypothetical protein